MDHVEDMSTQELLNLKLKIDKIVSDRLYKLKSPFKSKDEILEHLKTNDVCVCLVQDFSEIEGLNRHRISLPVILDQLEDSMKYQVVKWAEPETPAQEYILTRDIFDSSRVPLEYEVKNINVAYGSKSYFYGYLKVDVWSRKMVLEDTGFAVDLRGNGSFIIYKKKDDEYHVFKSTEYREDWMSATTDVNDEWYQQHGSFDFESLIPVRV